MHIEQHNNFLMFIQKIQPFKVTFDVKQKIRGKNGFYQNVKCFSEKF